MTRQEELEGVINGLPKETKVVVSKLVDYILDLEQEIDELKKLPHILYDKRNPANQKGTVAGKVYKDKVNLYLNSIKTLATIVRQNTPEQADPLLEALQGFQL